MEPASRRPIPYAELLAVANRHIEKPTPRFGSSPEAYAIALEDDIELRPIDAFYLHPENRPAYVAGLVLQQRRPSVGHVRLATFSTEPGKAELGIEEHDVPVGVPVRAKFIAVDGPDAAPALATHYHPYETEQVKFAITVLERFVTTHPELKEDLVKETENSILARAATIAESHRVWMLEHREELQQALQTFQDVHPLRRSSLWNTLEHPNTKPILTQQVLTAKPTLEYDDSPIVDQLRALQLATFEQAGQTLASLTLTDQFRLAHQLPQLRLEAHAASLDTAQLGL